MKRLHYISIFVVILSAIIFTACGKNDDEYKRMSGGQKQVLSNEENIEDAPPVSPSPDAPGYLVRLEGSTLTLYDTKSDESTVLKSLNLDTSYYSYEDIKELSHGIPAYSKEDGFKILENFTN